MNVHHKSIKRFGLDGTIYDSAHIDRLKTEYLALVVMQMRDKGYVPRIDIDYQFTMWYDQDKNQYNFKMSVYGVYVGPKKAQEIKAIMNYKPIYERSDVVMQGSTVKANGE